MSEGYWEKLFMRKVKVCMATEPQHLENGLAFKGLLLLLLLFFR